MSATIPPALVPLLERPLFAALGTVRPDDTVQVNPMWFEFDGEHVRFTHTNKRGKFRNLQRNPSMSLLLIDDENPQSYLELRGRLVEVFDDPGGDFYVRLGRRYGNPDTQPPPDKADRVVLVMSVEKANGR
jgi:PPOX class probable F420-dependent enzyme